MPDLRQSPAGGSVRIALGKTSAGRRTAASLVERVLAREVASWLRGLAAYQQFAERVERHRWALLEALQGFQRDGRLMIGYGASTKGNILLQHCGITPELLPSIAEVNADKVGCYTPGTLIPIISESEARALRPACLVVFPWHFRNFVVDKEREYLVSGGRLLFPLPWVDLVGR